jgi:hypothetical protein
MAKKSLPENPLVGGALVRVSEASAELVRFQDHMREASAITIKNMRNIKEIIDGFNLRNDILPECPQHITTAKENALNLLKNPDNLEYIFEEILPQMLSDGEREIITIENSRGDLSPETIAARVSLFQSFRELLATILSAIRREKALKALAALMDGLESLKKNPTIQDSPWVSDFITCLASEVGRSIEPHEVIASIAKTSGATNAANIRHAASVAIKIKVVEEWDRMKSENPNLTLTQAAKDMALDAVDWNVELGANLKSLETTAKTTDTIRKWLQNGNMKKIRRAMRA